MTQISAKGSTSPGKGKAFFERAEQVASTGNWDFAIEMFLEGIVREPTNLERGHKPLRDVAMKRKAQGGKPPGMMEGLKCRPGKEPLQNLRNAEYLLSKDPGNIAHMEQLLLWSAKLELNEVANWIGEIMLEAQRLSTRKDRRILSVLMKTYEEIHDYPKAVTACRMAVEAFGTDAKFREELRRLQTEETIQKGKYDRQDVDVSKKVVDADRQHELMEESRLIKGKGFLEQQAEKARKEYEAAPTVPGKIAALVDALQKIQEEGAENEAVAVLTKAFKETGNYQFKVRIGDIKITQLKRRYQKLIQVGEKPAAAQLAQEVLQFELTEFMERAENYPTDLGIRFELGRRQLIAGQVDEAIASLQQAQRDPRRHVQAMILLGQAFLRKGWLHEASDTYERVQDAEMNEDRRKEVLYYLGEVKEKMEEFPKAIEVFSQVAQMDFNYKDARARVEALRKKLQG